MATITEVVDLYRMLGIEETIDQEEGLLSLDMPMETYLAKVEKVKMLLLKKLIEANVLKTKIDENGISLEITIV